MKKSPEEILKEHNIFLWDPILSTGLNNSCLLFNKPIKLLKLTYPCSTEDVKNIFNEIDTFLKKGFFAAGWISYELGYLLHKKLLPLIHKIDSYIPLIWFGIFKEPKKIAPEFFDNYSCLPNPKISIKLNCSREKYLFSIKKIHEYIRSGDTYQINYTIKGKFRLQQDPATLYLSLRKKQKVKYASFIKSEDGLSVLSLSPELFFQIDKETICSKPMKGTAPRGEDAKEDKIIKEALEKDEKNRAENVMIVDLLRNDLGRICQIGTVTVPKLFKVEKYETLFQMISKIEGKLKNNISLFEIFKAIFPCGSITGAPKIRSMEIIAEVEREPRGIYTGAIGFLTPSGHACFNVAIRTLVLQNGLGELGIGAGITIGSDPQEEFKETVLKARFLTNAISY